MIRQVEETKEKIVNTSSVIWNLKGEELQNKIFRLFFFYSKQNPIANPNACVVAKSLRFFKKKNTMSWQK